MSEPPSHTGGTLLAQDIEHNTNLRTVLKEVVKELTEVLGRLEKLEKLLGQGYHDDGVSSRFEAPVGSEVESP